MRERPGAAPVVLGADEVAAMFPDPKTYTEDWYNRQLLVLAREARVAYALVWQTYFDNDRRDRYYYYYVPFPGHPEAAGFERFFAHDATCFLRDRCAP